MKQISCLLYLSADVPGGATSPLMTTFRFSWTDEIFDKLKIKTNNNFLIDGAIYGCDMIFVEALCAIDTL